MPRTAPLLPLVALLAMGQGCETSREHRGVGKAERVLKDVLVQDPQFTRYALDIAAHSTSSFSEALILEHLGATDSETVYAAAQAAARRPVPGHEDALQKILSSKIGAVRVQAAGALARLGDEKAANWLEESAEGVPGVPNTEAIRLLILAGRDSPGIQAILRKGLKAQEQEKRDEIYALLGEIGESWSVDLIVEGFEREHGAGRREAIVALGRAGDPARAAPIRRFIGTRGLVFATVEALGNLEDRESIPALQEMLGHPERRLQVHAAVALFKLGMGAEVQEKLGSILTDDDRRIRQALAEQLGSDDSDLGLSMLATLAEDPEPRVREEAVRGLREKDDPRLEQIFLGRVTDSEYEIASLALGALGKVGSASTLDAIEPLLQSENGYVAISAANAILEIAARVGEKPSGNRP